MRLFYPIIWGQMSAKKEAFNLFARLRTSLAGSSENYLWWKINAGTFYFLFVSFFSLFQKYFNFHRCIWAYVKYICGDDNLLRNIKWNKKYLANKKHLVVIENIVIRIILQVIIIISIKYNTSNNNNNIQAFHILKKILTNYFSCIYML